MTDEGTATPLKNANELQKARERLLNRAHDRIVDAEKMLKDARLEHDVLAACIKVWEEHCQRHPSTFGFGNSLASIGGRITTLETELRERQAEWMFLEKATLPPGASVTDLEYKKLREDWGFVVGNSSPTKETALPPIGLIESAMPIFEDNDDPTFGSAGHITKMDAPPAKPAVLPAGTKMLRTSSGHYRPAEPGEKYDAFLAHDVATDPYPDLVYIYTTNKSIHTKAILSKQHPPKGQP